MNDLDGLFGPSVSLRVSTAEIDLQSPAGGFVDQLWDLINRNPEQGFGLVGGLVGATRRGAQLGASQPQSVEQPARQPRQVSAQSAAVPARQPVLKPHSDRQDAKFKYLIWDLNNNNEVVEYDSEQFNHSEALRYAQRHGLVRISHQTDVGQGKKSSTLEYALMPSTCTPPDGWKVWMPSN